MNRKLEHDHLTADLAATESLLRSIPEDDVLGRLGLESRRRSIKESLSEMGARPDVRAAAALFFSGEPVKGSIGISSEFAGNALAQYQSLVAKVLALRTVGSLGARGVVPHRDAATLHLTNVARGSFGLLLEELNEDEQQSLLPSNLKEAADETCQLVTAFADADEDSFSGALVNTDRRVFEAIAGFFSYMRQHNAALRIVSGDHDRVISNQLVALAAERAQLAHMSETERDFEGELIGLLPDGHRFEFREAPSGNIISGVVTRDLTLEDLQELNTRLVGKRSLARMQVREITQPGREPRRSYTLLKADIDG